MFKQTITNVFLGESRNLQRGRHNLTDRWKENKERLLLFNKQTIDNFLIKICDKYIINHPRFAHLREQPSEIFQRFINRLGNNLQENDCPKYLDAYNFLLEGYVNFCFEQGNQFIKKKITTPRHRAEWLQVWSSCIARLYASLQKHYRDLPDCFPSCSL